MRKRKYEIIFLIDIIMTEFRSFAFTIRPLGGVKENGDLEKSVIIYLTKYRGFVVSEKEGTQRHLHGQIFYEKPKRKFDVNKALNLLCQRSVTGWDLSQQRVLHQGTKIAYNDDWWLNYTNKESESELLYHDIPGNTVEYYPTPEQQQSVQARTNAVDKTFHHLVELYEADPPPLANDFPDEEDIRKWLYCLMYIDKKIKVIEDRRKFNQRAKSLFHYIISDKSYYSLF